MVAGGTTTPWGNDECMTYSVTCSSTSNTTGDSTVEVWYYYSTDNVQADEPDKLPDPFQAPPWGFLPGAPMRMNPPRSSLRDMRGGIRAVRPRHGLD